MALPIKYKSKDTPALGPSEILAEELKEIISANKNNEIAPKLQRCLEMVTKLDSYLLETASPESDLQKKIYKSHFAEDWVKDTKEGLIDLGPALPWINVMISGQYEGQFLRLMAEMTKAKRILEIGMLTGYSAVSFAESPYCEELIALEIVPYLKTFVQSRIAGTKVEEKLKIMIGDAADSLVTLKSEGKKFDMVFIDADKSSYINYYKYVMDNDMLEDNGIVLCDNVLRNGDPYLDQMSVGGKDLHTFVKFVVNDARVNQVIIPVRDGVMIVNKRKADKNNN